jgi:2-polyprenyl-3-methyl-5-hydroxy-6-metoxy-1,4-benzoquinol methylase
MSATDAFERRLGTIMSNGLLCLNMAIGNRLRLFDELEKGSKENGKNSTMLAEALGLKERYVREWLGAVAVGQLVDKSDKEGQFYLSQEKAKHLSFKSGGTTALFSWLVPMCAGAYEDVVSAFQLEGPNGVPYSRYPTFHEWRHKLTSFSFPGFIDDSLLPACPEVWSKAEVEGISVCEVGCSEGILSLLLAQRFPKSKFWASDIGLSEIENAKKSQAEKGLHNITFEVRDVTKLPTEWTGKFDMIVIYDVIHDLGRPDLGVKELHRVLKDDGTACIVDIHSHTKLEDNLSNPSKAGTYTFSLFHCMPVSLACGPDAWGLGAAWGIERAEQLFLESGFKSVIVDKTGDECLIENAIYVCKKGEISRIG